MWWNEGYGTARSEMRLASKRSRKYESSLQRIAPEFLVITSRCFLNTVVEAVEAGFSFLELGISEFESSRILERFIKDKFRKIWSRFEKWRIFGGNLGKFDSLEIWEK